MRTLSVLLIMLAVVACVITLFAVVYRVASQRFKRQIDDEARALLARQPAAAQVVQPAELERLPAPVRRWLETSGVVGKERVYAVRLKQRGRLRTSPKQPFMPATAEQYFTVEPPGFVWRVDVTMMGVLPIAGRDKYMDGRGSMLIKAASLLSMVDASGEKIDQGTLLRFLGEIVWFPSAALSPYLTWELVDATGARATMRYQGVTASAVYSFDAGGRFVSLSAERYMGSGAAASLERWFIPATAWKVFHGVEVPSQGEVIWKLKDGDFSYYQWEITDLEFNRPLLYDKRDD